MTLPLFNTNRTGVPSGLPTITFEKFRGEVPSSDLAVKLIYASVPWAISELKSKAEIFEITPFILSISKFYL